MLWRSVLSGGLPKAFSIYHGIFVDRRLRDNIPQQLIDLKFNPDGPHAEGNKRLRQFDICSENDRLSTGLLQDYRELSQDRCFAGIVRHGISSLRMPL